MKLSHVKQFLIIDSCNKTWDIIAVSLACQKETKKGYFRVENFHLMIDLLKYPICCAEHVAKTRKQVKDKKDFQCPDNYLQWR